MRRFFFGILIVGLFCLASGCMEQPVSSSGIKKASIKIQTGADGKSVEQRNVIERLKRDNKPGSVKHLYLVSAYSGQCLVYSTVKGKVTSSGKRLTPTTLDSDGYYTMPVIIGGREWHTGEVIQDDGTYGHSSPYVYWFDVQGRYFQLYVSGGTFLIISDRPIPMKSVTMNLEMLSVKD